VLLRSHTSPSARGRGAVSVLWSGLLVSGGKVLAGVDRLDLRPLRVRLAKWFSLPRLETRTKESNIRASTGVANPGAQ
jgi:hypothetical protein